MTFKTVAELVEGSSTVEARNASPLHANGDLSHVRSIEAFVEQMRLVADECYPVLKPDHYCAILVGDTSRSKHYTPIAFRVMQAFLDAGFILKEDIVKAQWNTQTEGLWANLSRNKNFLLIMHEHLFVFRKPAPDERTRRYAESMCWCRLGGQQPPRRYLPLRPLGQHLGRCYSHYHPGLQL